MREREGVAGEGQMQRGGGQGEQDILRPHPARRHLPQVPHNLRLVPHSTTSNTPPHSGLQRDFMNNILVNHLQTLQ
jgi:hypothetical protein